MFSEYTSKFLSQSKARSEAPLFHSTNEHEEERFSGPSLYQSKRSTGIGGWVSSFADRNGKAAHERLSEDDEEEEDDDDLEPKWQTMESSASTNPMDSVRLDESVRETNGASGDSIHGYHNTEDDEDEDVNDPPADLAIEDIGMQPFVPLDLRPEMEPDEEQYIPGEVTTSVILPAPRFDAMFANIYIGMVSMVLGTSLIVWLSTSVPAKVPLGDTMYTVIKSSWGTIAVVTILSEVLAGLWIAGMQRYARFVAYLSIVSVPIGMFVMTIYPLVMSYRTPDGGYGSQDRAMRWMSLFPLGLAGLWVYIVYKGRHALGRSIGIVQLACTMARENYPLVFLGTASVFAFILITVIWVGMFARLFLQGHVLRSVWKLDAKSWIFGAWYVLVYLWTWGIVSGIQRAATAASISQWYFHRHEHPQPGTVSIVKSGLQYSATSQFGTICFSSLIRLLVRLPFLVLPRRVVIPLQALFFHLLSTSAGSATNPLALSVAVVNSQPLLAAARTLETLHSYPHSRTAYRLAKMLLSAARALVAVIMGFASWVHAARYTNGGSLYGYAVGFICGFIGWFVLGATEGVLSTIVDAAFICHALDHAGGHPGGHCAEADIQFG